MPDNASLVIEIIEDSVEKIKGFHGKWWDILGQLGELVSTETEKAASADWSSTDKKDFAHKLGMQIWERFLNIKAIPDFLERPAVSFILDKAIEAFVALMNKTGKWVHKTT